MSKQLTIRLPDELSEALERARQNTGLKNSELVRQALRGYLNVNDDDNPSARVRHLLGTLQTGVPDLAERHRDYVIASLKRD